MLAIHKQMPTPHRLAVIALVAVGLLMSACNGPTLTDASTAAVVNGQQISLTQYQSVTRLLFELNRLQTPGSPTWQQAAGRAEIVTVQKQVLGLLAQNILLEKDVKQIDPKLLAQLKQQEDTQLKQTFAQLPPQYKPLVDAGILTSDTVRPLAYNQLLLQSIFQKVTVPTAHIRILTVRDQQQAEDLRKTLTNGGDWATLATQHSLDPAKSAGGDVAVLVPGIFPKALDQQVFDPKTAGTAPFLVKSRLGSHVGWSVVQVVSRTPNIAMSQLPTQSSVFQGGTQSVQGAAVEGVVRDLATKNPPQINVNWCNSVSGHDCGPVIALDQLPA